VHCKILYFLCVLITVPGVGGGGKRVTEQSRKMSVTKVVVAYTGILFGGGEFNKFS